MPPEVEVRKIEHRWITLRDGIRLSARLWLPVITDNKPTPAILEYIPYRKRDMVRARDERNHPYFARHGYACLRVDMRGSGDSEGVMTDMYCAQELDDAQQVIRWIADQSWCDGSVGMMGTSWGGTASLQAAARQPEALKAIIAVCATNNRFDDDIHHMGGCLLTDSVEWGATLPAILASPPDPETVGSEWRRIWKERLEALSFPLEQWIRHETRDAYWRWGAVNETPNAIRCPVLAVGGWTDRYSNAVMKLVANHKQCWGIVGPWGHHYPDVASPGPGMGFQQEALRWWDRWLKGKDNGVDQKPRLRVWCMQYDLPQDKLERRSGRWISEAHWPSKSISTQDFWLAPAGLQSERPNSKAAFHLSSELNVGDAAGDTGYFGREGGLPTDQREDDSHCLVFETDPLAASVEILGSVRLQVTLTSARPVGTLVVRLNDVPAVGEIARVSYAVQNLALDEHGQPSEKPSNQVTIATLDFPNIAYRFESGHRLRLALSSSYWPIIWPSPQPARITLHSNNSRLTLPLRPPQAHGDGICFDDPLDESFSEIDVISAPPLRRRIESVPDDRRRSQSWHQPFKCVRFKAIDLEFGCETAAEHKIITNEHNSASTRFQQRLMFRREDSNIEVIGTAKLKSTETSFNPTGSIEVREDGDLVFQRQWAPVIPRTYS